MKRLKSWKLWAIVGWVILVLIVIGSLAGGSGDAPTATVPVEPQSVDQVPCIDQAAHHLADSAFGDVEPEGKVLTGDHRVVCDEVEPSFLRRAHAKGWRSLHHPIGVGYRCPLPLRQLRANPSAGAGSGDDVLQ